MIKAVLLGIVLGIVSGLTPGIHVNTFSAIILSYSDSLLKFFSPEDLAVVVFVNAIVHTFLDILPSTFLGIPDEDTAIAILPTHELVLEGKGMVAVSISAYSSLLSFLFSIPIFVLFLLHPLDVDALTVPVLLLVSAMTILGEKAEPFEGSLSVWRKRLFAAAVFVLSGMLGIMYFGRPMPLLTGLFASPTLLSSMNSEIPDQVGSIELPKMKDIVSGTLSGAMVSLFPGVSSGTATLLASSNLRDRKRIVSAISSANTSNAFLCFAVFLSSHRIRSGAVSAFKEFGYHDPIGLILVGLLASLVATLLTLTFGSVANKVLAKVSPSKLSYAVFFFLIALVVLIDGFFGLLIFSLATIIGLLTLKLGVRRVNCMGCVVVPALHLHL